ncbi:MAG: bifunctional adenosylcobinamide kinase/adenosylcobinamide-phosphate guanylyltransferase [Anaerolineae bacterium]
MSNTRLIFVLGGARSGKSSYAEQRAAEHGGDVLFVATAEALDDEMAGRIARHRADRPSDWFTLETPYAVGLAVLDHPPTPVVLVDCITLLASNIVLTLPESATQPAANAAVLAETDELLDAFEKRGGTWIVISNEVGMGIVPPSRLGRLYRDALGKANQRIAQTADEVVLMVAGLPWHLKGKT